MLAQQRHGQRVLMVTPAYAPSVGGVQTCARELATRLVARGVVGGVLTADETWDLPAEEVLDGVPVHRSRSWPRHGDQRLAPGLVPALRHARAKLVHVQCYQTFVAPLVMAVAARRGIPYALTFHGGGHSSPRRHRFRAYQLEILRPLLARAAALVATAEWEIEHYSTALSLARGRFVLIPNGADLPPAIAEIVKVPSLIVSIGRAERYKGHHRVLQALPHVLREVPDARLWIAGDGPFEPELRDLARRLQVAERVEIGAVRDRGTYASRLAGASVGALLSDFETHPMGALEAISVGLPMLVADNSGLAELASRGVAEAVPAEAGSRRHAAELVRLLRAPRRPPSSMRLPSWDDCADAHEALYDALPSRARLHR